MADTVSIPVPRAEWTLVAAGPLTDCLVTVTRPCFYLYAASAPARAVDGGHSILAFENINAAPAAGQSFWVLCPEDDTTAYVTAG